MATSAAALLVASVVFALFDRSTSLRAKTQDLSATARMVGSNSTAALSFGDAKSAGEVLSALQAKQNVTNACIYNKDGKVFASYSRDAAHKDFSPPPVQIQSTAIIGKNMVLFQPITLNGKSIGTIFIEADLLDLDARLTRFLEIDFLVLLASLWEGLFRPILTSLVYVVPIAAGASFVGSYIIDRQAEVHIAPPDVHVAPAEVHVAPAEVHVAPAEVHVAPTEVNIAPTISVLPPDTTGLQKQVTELSNNINLVNTQVIEIRKLLPELPSSTRIQTIQLTRDENFWSNFSHFDKTFTVLLGNERGDGTPALSTKSSNSLADSNTTMVTTAPPLSSTDNGSESVSNGLQFDLNVRQEPYPTEMISPAHKIGDRRPALIEIGQIQKSVLPPSGSLGNNPLSGNQASFFLCDWRIPARFLISKDSPKQCAPETQDGSKPPYYVFTKTSQYVSELDAYVSLDEASRKRFLFLGSRRIVLQIVPNVRPVVSAPSKPPQKTPGASSAAR
jgi:hypothetical protein